LQRRCRRLRKAEAPRHRAIGDSFTFCFGVVPADAWPAVLAERTGLRIYNFGMPSRGLYEYVQTLKAFALAKRQGFVVIAVYEGNVLRDALLFQEARRRPSAPAPLRRTGSATGMSG
jgi:hypothetical protein